MLFLALVFGVSSGIVAFVYDTYFEAILRVVWEVMPEQVVTPVVNNLNTSLSWFPPLEKVAWVYTLAVATIMGTLVGLTQRVLGSPGDLPEVVHQIHTSGRIAISQAPSMFVCSAFSIAAGGSLGPEAALLALCGSTTSWLARKVFGARGQHLRNCALMGMTAGLAAFFGVALGGSLFSLEVLHRTGLQFYEVATYAVATGVICLAVFRGLKRESFGAVWDFKVPFVEVDSRHIILGALMGVIAAGLALCFMHLHWGLKKLWLRMGLHEHHAPVKCGVIGGFLIGIIGVLLPPTMFWGEFEINTLANPSSPLAHIWPQGGIWGTDLFLGGQYGPVIYITIGFVKLLAISITVLSGFRGGFIFPTFFAGTAFGHAIFRGITTIPHIAPFIGDAPPILFCMTVAVGLETSITRTPLASTHILSILAGSSTITVPCLASALVALYMTLGFPFILSQRDRHDMALKELEEVEDESGNIILIERLDGSGAVQAHIHGRDMNAHLNEIRVNPSGSMDVHMHIDSQSPVEECDEVGAIGV
ncbi:g10111 [Coccomyxa elongata]